MYLEQKQKQGAWSGIIQTGGGSSKSSQLPAKFFLKPRNPTEHLSINFFVSFAVHFLSELGIDHMENTSKKQPIRVCPGLGLVQSKSQC